MSLNLKIMGFFLKKYFSKPIGPVDFPFGYYRVNIGTDRLQPGIDNVHLDVAISPDFAKTTSKISHRIITFHANAEHILKKDKAVSWIQERDEFKKLCAAISLNAVNKAKMDREMQVDTLAQMAVIKAMIHTTRKEFDRVIANFNEELRLYESTEKENPIKSVVLKEQLKTIQQQKNDILHKATRDLLKLFLEGQIQETDKTREANFGQESIFPEEFLTNPMFLVENPLNDFFMIEEYDILLGHRFEDPHQYDKLLSTLRNTLKEVIFRDPEKIPENEKDQDRGADEWISHVSNMDSLLNYFHTERKYFSLNRQEAKSEAGEKLKAEMSTQKAVLDKLYKRFKEIGLLKRVGAYFEIKPIYQEYCPPLNPQQVIQFLISSIQRKRILNHLKQLKGYYPKTLELRPLEKKIKRLKRLKASKEKEYLIQFLKNFSRFHRDVLNMNAANQVMDRISLISNEKKLNLSRANNTLYEFLLPHEEVHIEKPIINHVIIKSDVRGSTDITYRMKENGLNPASYFSLNFFDPISDILSIYGAGKVFIEGDAIILSISEQKGAPEEWYSVARACGLAMEIVRIVQRYNSESRKFELPVLEIGVGICFINSSPAFLFDGDKRIMISEAINMADRLSSCSKLLKRNSVYAASPFNLFVFQEGFASENPLSKDNHLIRYNVNGIELNPEGFEKLAREIDLKPVHITLNGEKHLLYTGKFPLMNGSYQRLIIREAPVGILGTLDGGILGSTKWNYYEICTDPRLNEFVKGKNGIPAQGSFPGINGKN
ncbi:MAG: hypothetical protein KKF30_03030 [Proteobacteria bacterium]|nr:hypothetical protein [Pseudomonadota bacterium]MBU4471318.1 hypothetical protein [Pseudomonadota bacterium]MCG2751677.1 hypothetical protein [Desulfobacteraceae bacterium]